MYKQNKLGIYVYDDDTFRINNISWSVNSITYNCNYNKFRIINHKTFGINIRKHNVQTK